MVHLVDIEVLMLFIFVDGYHKASNNPRNKQKADFVPCCCRKNTQWSLLREAQLPSLSYTC